MVAARAASGTVRIATSSSGFRLAAPCSGSDANDDSRLELLERVVQQHQVAGRLNVEPEHVHAAAGAPSVEHHGVLTRVRDDPAATRRVHKGGSAAARVRPRIVHGVEVRAPPGAARVQRPVLHVPVRREIQAVFGRARHERDDGEDQEQGHGRHGEDSAESPHLIRHALPAEGSARSHLGRRPRGLQRAVLRRPARSHDRVVLYLRGHDGARDGAELDPR